MVSEPDPKSETDTPHGCFWGLLTEIPSPNSPLVLGAGLSEPWHFLPTTWLPLGVLKRGPRLFQANLLRCLRSPHPAAWGPLWPLVLQYLFHIVIVKFKLDNTRKPRSRRSVTIRLVLSFFWVVWHENSQPIKTDFKKFIPSISCWQKKKKIHNLKVKNHVLFSRHSENLSLEGSFLR